MKSVIVRLSVVCLCLGVACATAFGAEDGAQWLMKINNAARQLNYEGTFVYVQGNRVESMRVTHRAHGGSMRQRIYSLNGAPREVIRDDKQIWCYIPDRKVGVHEYRRVSKEGFPNLLPQAVDHLVKYYKVYKGAEGRLADRRAQQIMVLPKDDFRYGYDLWADEKSGLLLKAVLLDHDKHPIEQYLFTSVDIGGDIPESELEPVTPKDDLVWYGDAQGGDSSEESGSSSDMSAGHWVIGRVPAGFMLTRKIKRLSPMRARVVEHYVYSDGLASVSVFVQAIDKGDHRARINGINKMGAVHAFGREINGHQITVVGEVPSQTVDLIGMSVSPKE
ncbi:MAG: MucB/RseB C-terminal domain-containing protein [Arenicellales bacterium]